MNDHRSLRLLTAMLLATWAPGSWWCCCSAHADEPAPDVPAATAADPDDCHAPSCCDEPDGSIAPAGGADDGCCPVNPDEAPSCGCMHAATNALPAAATAPPTGQWGQWGVDMLAELPPALTADLAPARRISSCRGSPRRVPAQSLLSLRCQLTT